MNIKVDYENKVVIATGSYKGKKIKVVTICREPEFDEEFGKKITKLKYKIKFRKAKINCREREIRRCEHIKNRMDNMIDEINRNLNILENHVNNDTNRYFELINSKY